MKRFLVSILLIAVAGSAFLTAQAARETVAAGDVMLASRTLSGTVSVKDGLPVITSGGIDYVLYYNRVRAADLGIEEGQTLQIDGFEIPSSHTPDDNRYFLVSKVYIDGKGHLLGVGIEQGRLVLPAEDMSRLIPSHGFTSHGYGGHTRMTQRMMSADALGPEVCCEDETPMAHQYWKGRALQVPAVPHRMDPPAVQQFQERTPQSYGYMRDRQVAPKSETAPPSAPWHQRGNISPRMGR